MINMNTHGLIEMTPRHYFLPISLFGFLLLVSCAPISEDACRSQSWRAIGIRDGEKGKSLGQFASYAEECAKYGISPNQSEWQSGREIGLKSYCTAENSLKIGRNGRSLNNVCAGDQSELKRANDKGLEIYKAERELTNLRNERADIMHTLRVDLAESKTEKDLSLRKHYYNLLEQVDKMIDYQERKLSRLMSNVSY